MRINRLLIFCFLCSLFLLFGCKTSLHKQTHVLPQTVTSKLQLVLPNGNSTIKLSGVMHMEENRFVRMTFLMPFLHSEIFRIELTPNRFLFIDKMNRRYGQFSERNMKQLFLRKDIFKYLQKSLIKTYKKGHGEVNADDLGFLPVKGAQLKFYRFKTVSSSLSLTEIPANYQAVSIEEIYYLIKSLS